MVKLQAKKNIVSKIMDGDVPISQWYAERKIKGEFSTRTEQTGPDGKDLNPITPEAESRAKAFDEWYKNQLKG